MMLFFFSFISKQKISWSSANKIEKAFNQFLCQTFERNNQKKCIKMTKKSQATHPLRRINLSLPIIQDKAYEIYNSMPEPTTRFMTTTHPKVQKRPLIDNNNNRLNNQTTVTRSPRRFKHMNGRVLINLFVEMPVVPTDSLSTIADTISNALMKSGFSLETLQNVQAAVAEKDDYEKKKDDDDEDDEDKEPTQPSTPDKLLCESIETVEEAQINKTKYNGWQNIHLPPLTTAKASHSQKTFKRASCSYDRPLKGISLGVLEKILQEPIVLPNDCLHNKIDKLTKNYFPAIQQLRHTYPEANYTRTYLNHEEKRNFLPAITRQRVVR